MSRRLPKTTVFVLEAFNILGAVIYYNYLFFFTKAQLGFSDYENLLLSALNGFLYVPGSWYGGRLAQKHGYFFALKLGFGGLSLAMIAGALLHSAGGQVLVLVLWTLPVCLTWPTLEALACEHENANTLPRRIGIYNVVWAGGAAVAYFCGGAVLERLGWPALFWIPAGVHALQLAITFQLERRWNQAIQTGRFRGDATPIAPQHFEDRRFAMTFQRMAWVANPFAYIAMNTVIPLIPNIAGALHLSTTQAGFVCSVWMFARLGAFFILWHWTAWHYRLGWLLSSYALLLGSFAAILLIPNLGALVLAQLIFGWAVGLIYYSSLFYSMDASETKGVHGGIHEAALGLGIFAGPAMGAAALRILPNQPQASAWAVSGALMAGLAIVWVIWRRGRRL
jgi:predicted MFS family arabinose efflux permease